MLNVHVEMDLNQHISVVSSKVLKLIQEEDDMILEVLLKKFLKKYEDYTPDQFMDGITFLFSIDCLAIQDYRVVIKNV